MLKKNLVLLMVSMMLTYASFAQGMFFTKTGKITFYSKAPLEEIDGKNKTVTAVLDSKSGALQFAAQMRIMLKAINILNLSLKEPLLIIRKSIIQKTEPT
jgi:hypothetical protein